MRQPLNFQILITEIELEGSPMSRGFVFTSDPEGQLITAQQYVDALSDYLMEEAAVKHRKDSNVALN